MMRNTATAFQANQSSSDNNNNNNVVRWCAVMVMKLLMFVQTMGAICMLIYALWLFGQWRQRGLPLDVDGLPAPWFVCGMVGVGILVFLVAFTGHIAADALTGCSLCLYAMLICILIVLEASLIGELVLNKQLEKELPYDSTGQLKKLRTFVENNKDICKCVAASFIALQVLSFIMAIILMIPFRRVEYDNDEDFVIIRRPLLYSQPAPTYVATSTRSKESR